MIGIVGGMGPHAGLDLVRKILDNTIASSDQEHVPISMLSIPGEIADRAAFVTGVPGAENPGPAIARAVDSLLGQGCSLVGIACNTAHAPPIFEALQNSLTKDGQGLLNMIEEVASHVASSYPGASRVGVLGTTATVRSGLYTPYLGAYGLEAIYLDDDQQRKLNDIAIRDPRIGIKAFSNPVSDEATAIVRDSIARLAGEGADVVLLACTELPLAVSDPTVGGATVLDPTNIFARAILGRFAPDKLRGDV